MLVLLPHHNYSHVHDSYYKKHLQNLTQREPSKQANMDQSLPTYTQSGLSQRY